jgi:hypothetical protein
MQKTRREEAGAKRGDGLKRGLWPASFGVGEYIWAEASRALGWEPRGLGQMAENFKGSEEGRSDQPAGLT